MRYTSVQITFQEVPEEISLCFLVSGCPLRCPGCHSADSWDARKGEELSCKEIEKILQKYEGMITCVCFLGGEWQPEKLRELCVWVQSQGLRTCLYTGLEDVGEGLKEVLDFLKVGPYIKSRGGLASPNTNQRFINLKTKEELNHYFTSPGGQHGQAQRMSNER